MTFPEILPYASRKAAGSGGVQTEWHSEENWRQALWLAREQLRQAERDGRDARAIYRNRSQVERIRAAGLPEWQERDEWAGFPFPPGRKGKVPAGSKGGERPA